MIYFFNKAGRSLHESTIVRGLTSSQIIAKLKQAMFLFTFNFNKSKKEGEEKDKEET